MDDVRLFPQQPSLPHTNILQDSNRLPEGMQRIGYDADTQSYTFRDASGALYESAPGTRYGELTPVGDTAYTFEESGQMAARTEEMEERNRAVDKGNREAVRMMLPFALLVLVFMFLLFKLVDGGLRWTSADGRDTQVLDCRQGSHQTQVAKGDTCWEIAEEYGVGVEELLGLQGNQGVECERLRVGQGICVPN